MKRFLILTAVSLAVIAALAGIYVHLNAQYPHFGRVDGGTIAVFPARDDGSIEVCGGVRFRIDTGSAVSLLTQKDLERLRANGAVVTEEWFPSLARDVNGEMFMAYKRYTVSLPVMSHVLVCDSTGNHYEPTRHRINTIDGMVFLPGVEDQGSVIGTDVLECFVIEYRHENNAIAFHNTLPSGYKRLAGISRPKLTNRMIGCGGRYYIDITTENNAQSYFIDTGIDDVQIKLPLSDTLMVKAPLHTTSYRSSRGQIPAKYIDEAWVKIGNRAGSHMAYYATDGEEDYAFNPLTYFNQDILIDFSGRALYVRPHSRLARR